MQNPVMRYLALLLMLFHAPGQGAEPIRVAVAANFRGTLEQATRSFTAATGQRVVFSSASTGVLYTQITRGAPYDLFFAADRNSAVRLETGSDTGAAFCYARGRLVLAGGDGGLAQLADPDLSLAIANPATAPYGRAAMAVLSRPEFSDGGTRKLVRGSNAVQAYQFWRSGAVDLALLPRAMAPGATPVPAAWHGSLDQYAIALASGPAVDAYLNWLRSDTVRTQITNAGYEPCP